jgi:hypothetical protein
MHSRLRISSGVLEIVRKFGGSGGLYFRVLLHFFDNIFWFLEGVYMRCPPFPPSPYGLNSFSVFEPVFVDGDANWRLVVFRERADFLARTNVLEDLANVIGCRALIV